MHGPSPWSRFGGGIQDGHLGTDGACQGSEAELGYWWASRGPGPRTPASEMGTLRLSSPASGEEPSSLGPTAELAHHSLCPAC